MPDAWVMLRSCLCKGQFFTVTLGYFQLWIPTSPLLAVRVSLLQMSSWMTGCSSPLSLLGHSSWGRTEKSRRQRTEANSNPSWFQRGTASNTVWHSNCFMLLLFCRAHLILLLFGETLTSCYVSGWSLKQKSKFSKSSPVIMFGQSYELKDQGEGLSSGPS